MSKAKLSPQAREERRKYYREWRRKNPDKVRKHLNDYWERKAATNEKKLRVV